jgi:hypothetical protein
MIPFAAYALLLAACASGSGRRKGPRVSLARARSGRLYAPADFTKRADDIEMRISDGAETTMEIIN